MCLSSIDGKALQKPVINANCHMAIKARTALPAVLLALSGSLDKGGHMLAISIWYEYKCFTKHHALLILGLRRSE